MVDFDRKNRIIDKVITSWKLGLSISKTRIVTTPYALQKIIHVYTVGLSFCTVGGGFLLNDLHGWCYGGPP